MAKLADAWETFKECRRRDDHASSRETKEALHDAWKALGGSLKETDLDAMDEADTRAYHEIQRDGLLDDLT